MPHCLHQPCGGHPTRSMPLTVRVWVLARAALEPADRAAPRLERGRVIALQQSTMGGRVKGSRAGASVNKVLFVVRAQTAGGSKGGQGPVEGGFGDGSQGMGIPSSSH